MKVKVDNKTVDIAKMEVIGSGGEGLVVKTKLNGSGPTALKVYHQPSKLRSKKLTAFFKHQWNLPTSKIALPQKPVYNMSGDLIVGVTMPYLGTGFEEVALFSNRKRRLAYGVTTKSVMEIFLDGHQALEKIHAEGLVVGDLNDLNVLFRGNEMLWIDVDAWQFGAFALEFLDPALYGIDLSKKPVFKDAHDWYSFAVMLFRSLLLVHPYGGVHKQYKSLQKRAKNKVTALDSGVKYPKIAFSPDILSDELADEFLKIFKSNSRGIFPKTLLMEYLHSLTECQSCHTFYPSGRTDCPVCNRRTLVIISQPVVETMDVRATQMFTTQGNIVYTKVQGNKIFAISHYKNKAVLHIVNKDGTTKDVELGRERAQIRYAIADNLLAINPIHSPKLTILDINRDPPKILQQSVTEIFTPSRKAAFQVTGNKIIRMVGGNIMAMEKGGINVIERHIRNGMPNQTWFAANNQIDELQLFGFIQVLRERKYWAYFNGRHFEPKIPKLDDNEGLVDISVRFSTNSILLRKKTQRNGVDYIRTDTVDEKGEVFYSNQIKLEDHPVNSIHGQAYSSGILIHATDDGILQERVAGTGLKSFPQTEPFVKEGDALFKFRKGLLVVGSSTITYLELTK